MRFLKLLLVLPVFAVTFGCAVKSGHMQPLESEPVAASPDQATVVFLRPSLYGGAIQASLFKVEDGVQDFIGISSAQTGISYALAPGTHRFMVIGESADFLDAHLEAGKTYYAVVSPRMGFWKARFSFVPVRNERDGRFSLDSDEFRQWLGDVAWVGKTDSADEWFRRNRADIDRKHDRYLEVWLNKSETARGNQTLFIDDGR